MLASIFIPTGNRAKSLKAVLQSLTKQTYKRFEVIIVDYKSTDETNKVIESYKEKFRIIILHQKTKGLARAANMALKKARGTIFIRTDDDVVMSPGWLSAIVQTFQSDSKIGGVTGPTIIPATYKNNRDLFIFENKFRRGNVFWKLLGKLYFDYFMEGEPYRVSHWFDCGAFGLGSNFERAKKEPIREVTNLEACNFSVRTNLLRKVHGFDISYGGVGEYHEADAAFKIKRLEYKLIFNPKALLNHMPSQSGFYKDRSESYSRMTNFVVFYMRHIRPNSFRKFSRFISYIIFLDCYYIFTALRTGNLTQLGAIPGTLAGVIKYYQNK